VVVGAVVVGAVVVGGVVVFSAGQPMEIRLMANNSANGINSSFLFNFFLLSKTPAGFIRTC
jgi:hypothetical protein